MKQGYSKATIKNNVRSEIRAGLPHYQAVNIAYKIARDSWKTRNKGKRLPNHLRAPNPDDYSVSVRKRSIKNKNKRTPAQIRATKRLVALNRKRAKTPSNHRRATQSRNRVANPIRWVIQAINVKTGAQGWFTGDGLDDDVNRARTYAAPRGATIVAKQLFKTLPSTWRLIVTHEHRPK